MSEVYMQLYDIPQIHYPVSQGDFRNLSLNHCLCLTPSLSFSCHFCFRCRATVTMVTVRKIQAAATKFKFFKNKDCTHFRRGKKICQKQEEWSKNSYEKGISPNDSDHNSSVAPFEMFVSTWISTSAAGSEDVSLCQWLKGNYTERWLRGYDTGSILTK